MNFLGLHWVLSLTVGGAGLGFGLFLLVGLVALSYYLSPYYPFMRFLMKQLCYRAMAKPG